jgi:hypothetical protein
VAKEKSEQVLELGEQLDLVKKDQLAVARPTAQLPAWSAAEMDLFEEGIKVSYKG